MCDDDYLGFIEYNFAKSRFWYSGKIDHIGVLKYQIGFQSFYLGILEYNFGIGISIILYDDDDDDDADADISGRPTSHS